MTGWIRAFCSDRSGNVFTMIFAATALMGVLGVSMMNLVIGPATTVTKVTHQNMAQNDLLMNAKVTVMNAATLDNYGDSDGDGYVEPAPFIPTSEESCAITLPEQGGCLPADIGAILTDPWGTQYAYCVWDHGETNSSTNRITGEDSTSGAVIAILSAGPNKQFETPCSAYDGDPETNDTAIDTQGIGDDLVQIFTYAAATAGSGGLWELKEGEPNTATIAKDIEIEGAFRMGTAGEDEGQVGLDSCTGMNHLGRMRFNPIDNAIEVCSFDESYGWETIAAAGGSVPVGTIAAFDGESCPDNWEAVTGLQGRMVMGAGGGYAVGDTGGAATVALTIPQMPIHAHAVDPPSTLTNTGGQHSHTMAHSAASSIGYGVAMARSGAAAAEGDSGFIGQSGTHQHSVDIAAFSSGTSGGGEPHENRPPYRVYLYCAYMGGGDGVVAESINDLTDIDTSGAQDNDILVWNEGAGQWLPEGHWVKDDTDLFYEGGNVGIGTNEPGATLNIRGDMLINRGNTEAPEQYYTRTTSNQLMFNRPNGSSYIDQRGTGGDIVFRMSEQSELDILNALVIRENGNVGIGTDEPEHLLHVANGRVAVGSLSDETYSEFLVMRKSPSSGTENYAALFVPNSSVWEGGVGSSGTLGIWAGGSPRMTVQDDGNVGIGTTNPQFDRLHVEGDRIRFTGPATSYDGIIFESSYSGVGNGGYVIRPDSSPGSGTANFYTHFKHSPTSGGGGGITHHHVLVDGNVGIGTSSPSYKLHVAEASAATGIRVTGAGFGHTASRLILESTGDADYRGQGVFMVDTTGGQQWYAGTPYADTDQYVIARSGSGTFNDATAQTGNSIVVVNSTGLRTPSAWISAGGTPAGSFVYNHTRANLAPSGYIWSTMASGGGSSNLYLHRHDTSQHFILFGYGSNGVGSVSTNGSSVSYNTTSDYRLKENIGPLKHALDRLMALRPARYSFKNDETHEAVDGFLAHEVQEIAPYAVEGDKDAVDEERNPVYQQLDYSKLTPLLTGAIQELKAILDGLIERVAELFNRADAHDKRIAELEAANDNLQSTVSQLEIANDNFRRELAELKAAMGD